MDLRHVPVLSPGLGDFDPLSLIGTIGGAAIQAGGQVGAAALTASAQEDVAKENEKAALVTALANERAAEQAARVGAGSGGATAQASNQLQIVAAVLTILALIFGEA